MTDFIEHPDHTGMSANPDAPWNQPDATECEDCRGPKTGECPNCGAAMCEECDGIACPECYDGPADGGWSIAEAASLAPPPDTRNEHQV